MLLELFAMLQSTGYSSDYRILLLAGLSLLVPFTREALTTTVAEGSVLCGIDCRIC